MTRLVMNSYNGNREFSAAVRAKTAELEAIFAELNGDLAKAEAKLAKLGFGRDSLGQWFKDGELIPVPNDKSHSSGVLPLAGK